MSTMSTISTTNMCESECPICMEIIDLCKNCSTTECGHKFHSNCLMKSIAFNGFGCPYCRFEMVEEIDDSDDDDDDEYQDGDEESDEEGDENEEDDNNDEEENEDGLPNQNEQLPSFELIEKKFIEKGITYECLVKSVLFNSMIYHKNEDFAEYQKCNTFMEEIFFDLVTKYNPEQEEETKPDKNELNFYFLQDEYIQKKYHSDMETALEKFLALDDDDDENILNNVFLNNRFMEVI